MDKKRCEICNVTVKSLYYHNQSQIHQENVEIILKSSFDPKDQEIYKLRKLVRELQEALRTQHAIYHKF